MEELYTAVRHVLAFHPRTVTNYECPSPSFAGPDIRRSSSPAVGMAETAETLVAQLVRVLSRGLHDGIELWSVLETLERVPSKVSREDTRSPARQAAHRLKFSGQLVYVIRSTLVRSTAGVRTRALLRLALSQGCLLAALELIARWNAEELCTLYANPSLSVLCSVDGELWDAFLSACAPIGGVMLADIEAGVPKGTSVVKFDLKLVLPGVDEVQKGRNEEVGNTNNREEENVSTERSSTACDSFDVSDAVSPNHPREAPLPGSDIIPVKVIPIAGEKQRKRKKRHSNKVNSPVPLRTEDKEKEIHPRDVSPKGDLCDKEVVNQSFHSVTERNPQEDFVTPLRTQETVNIKEDTCNTSEQCDHPCEKNVQKACFLLERAERLLLARWKLITIAMEEMEAQTFAHSDRG